MKIQKCDCCKKFIVKLASENDYNKFKSILNKGKHPAFIGRETMKRKAKNGGALFYIFEGEIVAVSLINPHYGILLALNVIPKHRGHHLGKSIVDFLMPNFVRAIENKVSWFEKLDYVVVGEPKKGVALITRVMVRKKLFELAGKLNRVWGKND